MIFRFRVCKIKCPIVLHTFMICSVFLLIRVRDFFSLSKRSLYAVISLISIFKMFFFPINRRNVWRWRKFQPDAKLIFPPPPLFNERCVLFPVLDSLLSFLLCGETTKWPKWWVLRNLHKSVNLLWNKCGMCYVWPMETSTMAHVQILRDKGWFKKHSRFLRVSSVVYPRVIWSWNTWNHRIITGVLLKRSVLIEDLYCALMLNALNEFKVPRK